MIQKKRINNDVFVRWGVFTPEGLPVDLTEVTSITIEARPQSSNGRYPMVSEVVDNFVEAYFLAKDQKVVGKYNLYLTYTIDDPNIIGGVATYTIDYCDAFELLPKSCFVDGEDDVDPVNIQGIIASFTYSMLTEEEKNDLASRLSGNSGAQNLSDLLDVTISNLEIDQILKYDGTKWVNATPTGGSSSNVSWGIPTSQYTPLAVNGVTRNLSLNNHTHHWDTITNRPLTDEQFQDLLEIADLWKLDNNGNLYTERNVYSYGEVSAYNWGESPTPPVGVYNLKDLLDVGIINPQENNILRFNGSHWVNVPASDAGTLVEWSSETDNYINLLVGDSSKSISLHGHKHEIGDINNLQDSLDFKQDNIPLGDISQYYRGDKEWAPLNTDTVVESTNLYYTPERVIGLTGDLYAQKDHTHAFNSLTGLPNTLDGYGIIDAYNKTEIDNLISSTSGFWVKAVGLEAPTGFTVSNSPIIYEGNIKLSFASGYSLPSNSKQYNWDLAFSDRHTHTNISVLNELTIDDVNNWNSIQEHLNDYNNPHKVSFKQLINKPSTLLGYGITDVYSKTEVDYIFNNITPGEPTIKNVYGYDSINQSFNNDTLSDTFNAYTISRLHDRLTILEQGDTNLDTIINWYNNIGRYWLLDADNDALYTNKNVYSTQEISAYGLGPQGGGGGGDIDMLDDWANYTEAKADYYVPASLLVPFRNDTLSRLISLEAGGGAHDYLPLTGGTLTGDWAITATEGVNAGVRTYKLGGYGILWAYRPTTLESIRHGIGFGWYNTEWVIGNIRGGSTDSYGFGIGYRNNSTNEITGAFRIATNGTAYLNNVQIATVNSNVASATKLNTARTIWGQSFDGTGNVSGAITGATTGNFSGTVTSPLYQSGTYNWATKTGGFHSGVDGYLAGGLSWYNGSGTSANIYRLNNNLILGRGSSQSIVIGSDSLVNIGYQTTIGNIKIAVGAGNIIERDNGLLYIQYNTSNNLSLVNGGGNVGIGTTTPSQKLHVVGNILATGEVTAYVASDRRLKENITPITLALDYINRLNPVTYNWNAKAKELNSNKPNSLDYGLIAQEVESVLPNIVHGIFDDKYKSIDYIKLIPIMVGAIKELKQEINRLKIK